MEGHVKAEKQHIVKPLYSPTALQLFDTLRFSILPRLNYWMDGKPGKRTLFIADEEESVVISFEEGSRCLDLANTDVDHCYEYRCGSRYLHQARAANKERANARGCIFFHMEITDHAGATHCLPGQMLAPPGYPWAEGVESILIQILNSITIVDPHAVDCT